MRDPFLLLKSFLSENVTVLTRDLDTGGNIDSPNQEYKGILIGFDEHFNIGLLTDEKVMVIKGEAVVFVGQE